MQQDGPAALRAILREHREPLSAVVIDTHIEGWKRHLRDIDGRLRAMRSTAALIAGLLPPETVAQVARLTKGRDLLMLDDMLRPVENPELVQIARIVPLNTACQVMRAASTLDFDASEVLAEVANAASRSVRLPKGRNRVLRDDPRAALPDRNHPAAGLARTSFPSPPLAETPRPQARRRERERSSAVGRGPRLAR
jgi:hypothetical protein